MRLAIDPSHGCESGGGVAEGLVPVQQKASSACCGAPVNRVTPGSEDFTCRECKKPTTKVMSDATAHWTCHCGARRSQVITRATDEAE